MHGNIKPSNLLFGEDGVVKLGDYGLLPEEYSSDRQWIQWHSAPEVFNGEREFKSDVWSLGITLMELVEGEIPYRIVDYWSTAKDLICREDPPSLSSEECSAECVDFYITPSITDLQSFKEWWIHTDEDSQASFRTALFSGKVYTTFPLHSQIQFNAGFWSLVDISLVDYHELISVITAGRLWVMEVFHVVVNTGIILGGYAYPAVILDAIRQSGVEFLIVYHTATNTMYTMDDPMGPFYAHGGLQADGKSVSPNPNLFLAEQQLVWFDELTRWVLMQMSSQHPNKQHVVLLWNVWSNKCGSIAEAYAAMKRLLTRVNSNRMYSFTASLASLEEYSQLLAAHHGKLPRRHDIVFPAVLTDTSIPHEIGPYSNKPAVKGHIRHALAALRQIETFFAIASPTPLSPTLLYALQYAREQLAFSANRYFLGGMAVNPTLDEVEALVAGAARLVALGTSQREVSFALDDTDFDMQHSIFENTVELGRTESLVVRVVNVQSVHRHAVMSFQVGVLFLCVEDEEGDAPNFQLYKDFENLMWIFLEVDLPPLGEKRYVIRSCKSNQPFQTTKVPFDYSAETRVGTPDFGVILNARGKMKCVEVDGKRVEFRSQLAYYHGGTDRRTRTGYRVFSPNLYHQMTEYGAELVSGLYSYLPKNAAIPIEIRDGPLMAEITQVFSDHAVLKTRVFKPQQRCAHSRLLQQVILLDRLNLTDEATLFVTSNVRNGGKVMVDEGGAGGREVEMVSLTYGYNYHPIHSFLSLRGRVNASAVRIAAFPNRLHAGGAHQYEGSMSFLLRRASQWADIADYPEPSTNAWERQRNLLLKPDRDMVNVASSAYHGRSLLSVKKVDRFHRFLWLAGTSADRDVRDMRVKDEEVVSIDPMVVSFAFDVGAADSFKPSLDPSVLPPFIRLLGAVRPFAARNEVVVQLESVQREGVPEAFSICGLFRGVEVKAFKEVDITGLFTNVDFYKRQTVWFPKQRMPAVCSRIVIRPGMIRSFSFSF
ncbi:protein kinase NPK2 [Blastocystis sp. ATCC 50177/Nand II]|uniref:Protein kinase NPK2 n=1 Tax=Blastocystis sp. subtype 1 (strain ATCC 50177 / NandII) TaxID=478820 RepID=A0A196SKY6_BLAHN|nr:protein kinase NPK2 [Blastocystis sp. ATCC 50177/Nand II]